MPTFLPPRRAVHVKKRPSLFDIAFNTALVVSALMLTFAVLVREEQFALERGYSIQAPGPTDPETGMIQPN